MPREVELEKEFKSHKKASDSNIQANPKAYDQNSFPNRLEASGVKPGTGLSANAWQPIGLRRNPDTSSEVTVDDSLNCNSKSYLQDSSNDGTYDYSCTPTHSRGQDGEPYSILDPNDPQHPYNKNPSIEDLNRRDFMFRTYVGGLELINEDAEDDDVSISSEHLSELAHNSTHNQTGRQSIKATDRSPDHSHSRNVDSIMASGRGRRSAKRIHKMGSKKRSQDTGNSSIYVPSPNSMNMSRSNVEVSQRRTITDMDESSNS